MAAQEASTRERLAEIDAKIQRLVSAVEQGLAGTSVQARLRELENQQATLKSELAEIRTRRKHMEQEPLDPDKAMALFARFAELFEQATAEEKEALADTILKSATVGPDESVEFEFYAGSDPCNVVRNDKFGSLLLF